MTINDRNLLTGAAGANQRARQFAAKRTSRPIWDAPRLHENGIPNIAQNHRLQPPRRLQVAAKRTEPRIIREVPENADMLYPPARGRVLQLAVKRTAPVRRIQTARKSTSSQIYYMRPADMHNGRHENLQLAEDEESDSDLEEEEDSDLDEEEDSDLEEEEDSDSEEDEVINIDSDSDSPDDDDDDEGSSDKDKQPAYSRHIYVTSSAVG